MKQILVITLAMVMALGASAQHRFYHGGIGGGYRFAGPRVSIGIGAPLYPYYGYSPYYGYPGTYYGNSYRPSKLTLKIEDIKNDYDDRIWSAKHDTSLSRKERRELVHNLKRERDQAVIDAKRNYYKY